MRLKSENIYLEISLPYPLILLRSQRTFVRLIATDLLMPLLYSLTGEDGRASWKVLPEGGAISVQSHVATT